MPPEYSEGGKGKPFGQPLDSLTPPYVGIPFPCLRYPLYFKPTFGLSGIGKKTRRGTHKRTSTPKRVFYKIEASTLKLGLFLRLYGLSLPILVAIPVNRGQHGTLKLPD